MRNLSARSATQPKAISRALCSVGIAGAESYARVLPTVSKDANSSGVIIFDCVAMPKHGLVRQSRMVNFAHFEVRFGSKASVWQRASREINISWIGVDERSKSKSEFGIANLTHRPQIQTGRAELT
jgi:hypothetical protein